MCLKIDVHNSMAKLSKLLGRTPSAQFLTHSLTHERMHTFIAHHTIIIIIIIIFAIQSKQQQQQHRCDRERTHTHTKQKRWHKLNYQIHFV